MDVLLGFLVVALPALLVAAPIMSFVALRRTRALDELADRVRRLESEVRGLRAPVEAARAAPRTEPGRPPAAPRASAPTLPTDLDFEVGPRRRERKLPELEWERLVGIRGAAILGGIALSLAGFLLFRHGIQQGWFTPELRVVAGTALGLFCLAGKELLVRRGYRVVSEVLAGAGSVVLYATAWAAFQRYEMIGQTAAFAWMAVVTAACCALAVRHGSQVIAFFGLVGGFATPLLVSQGENRPYELFGYVLILDVGLLAIGRRMRWPSLAFLGVFGTALWQGAWMLERMDAGQARLGLAILGLFGVVFTAAAAGARDAGARAWRWSPYASMAIPLLLALYFAGNVEFSPEVWPLAGLLLVVGAGAAWVARRNATPELPVATSLGSVGVLWAWLAAQPLAPGVVWQFGGAGLALALVQQGFAEWARRADGESAELLARRPGLATLAFSVATLLALAHASALRAGDVPFVATWVPGALALALTWRASALAGLAPLVPAGALALGLAHAAFALREEAAANPYYPGDPARLWVSLGAAAALFAGASIPARDPVWRWWSLAPLAFALPVLGHLAGAVLPAPAAHLGTVLALGGLAALGSARAGWPLPHAAAITVVGAAALAWSESAAGGERTGFAGQALAWQIAIAVVLALAPFAFLRANRGRRAIWGLSAASLLVWFTPPTLELFEARWPAGGVGLVPLALGLVAGCGLWLARLRWSGEPPRGQKTARTWYAGAACLGVCSAFPLEVDVAWGALAAALTGLAWTLCGRRLASDGLTAAGTLALATAGIVLCALALPAGYFRTADALVLNAISYAYLVPIACVAAALAALRAPEAETLRRGRAFLGLLLPFLVFGWLDTIVLNAFAEGSRITFEHGDMRRDVVQSIVWAAYSLTLLGLGMARRLSGLRWLSLLFLLATIGKVFLYDLSELEGLFRVFSMLGLALSLLAVSLLYQRFVFQRVGDGSTGRGQSAP